jgi:hypothetical protein
VHTCVSVYACMYEERERISVTLVTVTTSRVCQWSLHVRARACVCWYYFVISLLRLFVYRCTPWHKHTHTSNTKNTGQYMSSNDGTPTLSLEHSISVLSHEKHAHSLKPWKPVKNAGWQGRQLAPVQTKLPVSRRNRELVNQLQGILKIINTKGSNLYIHRHKYACWYVWLYEERGRISVRQPAVRYTQKRKQTNMHTCVSVHGCVYAERERISVTLVTTAAQGCASDLCMCARACVFRHYFANLSTVSVCLPVCFFIQEKQRVR